ncbi:MAG: hypothetical protein K0B10_07600 [Vicingaceae bacterium]|nr:hypothetical protein [Vicingaceae bacterium]
MGKTGIWIDSKKAYIVSLSGSDTNLSVITSEIEGVTRIEGEGKEYGRFGDQYTTLENKQENRRKHEVAEYLEEVVENIKSADEIVVFGPAEMKIEFEKLIRENQALAKKLLEVVSADSMTENQIVAWVKDYYKA